MEIVRTEVIQSVGAGPRTFLDGAAGRASSDAPLTSRRLRREAIGFAVSGGASTSTYVGFRTSNEYNGAVQYLFSLKRGVCMKNLIACVVCLCLAANVQAGEVSLALKVSEAKAFKPSKPGAKTCEFTANVVVKNDSQKEVVVSRRALLFRLSGPDGEEISSPPLGNDTPENLADAFPLPPGKSQDYTIKFHMNGATVEPGKAYKLKVAAHDSDVEKAFKFDAP